MASAREVGAKFIEAFNSHDEDAIRTLNAENIVLEAPGDVRIEGREAATEYAMAWLRAFSDARLTVKHELVDGDWVVQECAFTGTHDGVLASPAGEIPATNKKLDGRSVQIVKVEGDVVTDTRLYFDQVQVLTQLGLMPEPAAATA
jgi:predicted ester cyclase